MVVPHVVRDPRQPLPRIASTGVEALPAPRGPCERLLSQLEGLVAFLNPADHAAVDELQVLVDDRFKGLLRSRFQDSAARHR